MDCKKMVDDGVVLNGQEDISTSESDIGSTSTEQTECIGTEQLKVSSCMCMYM